MPKALEQQRSVALLAGFVCFFIAFTVIVLLPSFLTDADEPKVVGEDGVARDVHERTEAQQEGRHVYENQVCWHCHSDFVRPVNDEVARFGPVSQSGEYAFDLPHLFGTRRIGPDLHREGGARIPDWHLAHFFNPRFTVPHSVMPAFTWLFYDQDSVAQGREVLSLMDVNGDGMFSKAIGDPVDTDALRRALVKRGRLAPESSGETPDQKRAREAASQATLDLFQNPTAYDRWGLKPPDPSTKDQTGDPMAWVELPEIGDGLLTDYDLRPLPSREVLNLVDFVDHRLFLARLELVAVEGRLVFAEAVLATRRLEVVDLAGLADGKVGIAAVAVRHGDDALRQAVEVDLCKCGVLSAEC